MLALHHLYAIFAIISKVSCRLFHQRERNPSLFWVVVNTVLQLEIHHIPEAAEL